MTELLDHFHAGGFFMYFILLFAILTFSFIIERTYALYIKYKGIPADFRQRILSFVASGDYKSATDYIEMTAGETSVGKIASVGCKIRAAGGGDEALQARMDEQLSKEINYYDKRTGFLSMFGNVSTLFGLLGTVTGLIMSFAGVAAASPVERANLLSQGISEALNSTAFGLVAAIPALVAYAIFQSKTDGIVDEITEQSTQIFHDILFYTESETDRNDVIPGISSKMKEANTTKEV
ncbi:MAG: MotA/TolQ/ExbB proton channel family protein [Halobacteriovoraceae bacterium]|nr:MotA/TolQ/ExbB proton channel family protein [Halobacteriovoraceae bacterium]MCB9093575.1 MotA/TolQ/ExbB proton channel family protein [Halobacteriovoraceae bacterium]